MPIPFQVLSGGLLGSRPKVRQSPSTRLSAALLAAAPAPRAARQSPQRPQAAGRTRGVSQPVPPVLPTEDSTPPNGRRLLPLSHVRRNEMSAITPPTFFQRR